MTTRADQKEATRNSIMAAALRLSAERGVSSLSLRAVANEAGIAPASFYRHFRSIDDLGLALVDQVGMSLRQLVREARHRVDEHGNRNVISNCINTFMEFASQEPHQFRLLLGEGAGNTPEFRRAISKEISRFADDLAEDLVREAEATDRPILHPHHAAEAMVTVAFNLGVASLDLPPEERPAVAERIIVEVRMIMRGAQAMADG